ncbi:MAG TPA: hypothetical protein VFV41_13435 [Streptosporangiaceae bacterium]|nr:hypothetical protein [Streptosporangiaceae bacterium]
MTTALALFVAGNVYTSFKSSDSSSRFTITHESAIGLTGAGLGSAVLALVAGVMLTAMLTGVIGRGVLGQRVGIGQAWRLAWPRLGAIIGVVLLTWLILLLPVAVFLVILFVLIGVHLTGLAVAFGIIAGLALFAGEILLYTRLVLATPVLILERLRPVAALRRSWQLSARTFWRLFGILLLTGILVYIATIVVEIPFTVLRYALSGGLSNLGAAPSAASVIVGGVGGIVAAAITRPVIAGVVALLYIDMRMRKEGLDLALRSAAGSQAMTGDEFAALWQAPAPGSAPGGAAWPPGGPGPGGPPPPAAW